MLHKLGVVANTCNHSTQEGEAGESEAQGNLSYAPYLRNRQTVKRVEDIVQWYSTYLACGESP